MTELGPRPGCPSRAQRVAQYFQTGRPLTMLTACNAMTARIIDAAGVDMTLVDDSYGTIVLGMDSTVEVTLDDMIRATDAMTRGTRHILMVGDLPFGTYESSHAQAVDSAVALMRARAAAAKLGGERRMAAQVKAVVGAGVNVMGHLGFTPQSKNQLGGKRMQGRGDAAHEILENTLALQEAGAFVIVFGMAPASTAAMAVKGLNIPIIGIGAGPAAAGQVLVWYNIARMQDWKLSFTHQFGNVSAELSRAALAYHGAMVNEAFSTTENFHQN